MIITEHAQAKGFLKLSSKRSEEALLLGTQKMRQLVAGFLTGHCTLKYHLKMIGLTADDRYIF